jgi:hypothetical protein
MLHKEQAEQLCVVLARQIYPKSLSPGSGKQTIADELVIPGELVALCVTRSGFAAASEWVPAHWNK